jgi:hypothetical protein
MNDSNAAGDQIAALQRQVFTLLVALIVVSGTVTVYLYRQAAILGKDVEASQQLINSFTQNQPAIKALGDQLGAYGMTHPDIRPLLAKYGIANAPTQPLPPGAAPRK